MRILSAQKMLAMMMKEKKKDGEEEEEEFLKPLDNYCKL